MSSYGLQALYQDVADNPGAVTRFVLVSRPGSLPAPTGADKTTIQVALPVNESGALLTMLEQFAVRGVDLSRIESRPSGDGLGNYEFSIDIVGHVSEERVQAALVGLHRHSPWVRFMGSYPRIDGVANVQLWVLRRRLPQCPHWVRVCWRVGPTLAGAKFKRHKT